MAEENKHLPGPTGGTAAVFITPEDRAKGIDPAAVAAELARSTAAAGAQMGNRGVSVQMLPGAAPPLPGTVNSTPAGQVPAPRANTPLLQAPPGGVQSWGAPGVVAVARTHSPGPILPAAPAQPPTPAPLELPAVPAASPAAVAGAVIPVEGAAALTLAQLFDLKLEADGSILLPQALARRVAIAFPGLGVSLAPAPMQPVPPEATAASAMASGELEALPLEALTPPDLPAPPAQQPQQDDPRGSFGYPAGSPLLIEIRGPVTIITPGRLRVTHLEDPESGGSEVTIEPATEGEG